jgi:hypothetical protein
MPRPAWSGPNAGDLEVREVAEAEDSMPENREGADAAVGVGPSSSSTAGADNVLTVGGSQADNLRSRPSPSTPTREDMLAAGHSRQSIDARQVRDHQMEVIQEHFTRWVLVFSLVMCMLLPAMLGLFIWLVYAFVVEYDEPCDVPLKAWVVVVCSNTAYHFNFGLGSVHTLLLKCCCKYDPTDTRPAPCHVKLYNALSCLLNFAWHCVGLHWVRTSDTCEATAPALFESVKVFAAFSVVFNIFVYINTLGIHTIVMFMLRNGMIKTNDAAPEGTLEKCSIVTYNTADFEENQECSICMEEFDSTQVIRRTRCGHVFHSKCLAGWLKAGHTCPLCRTDLAGGMVDPEVKGAEQLPV